jgi:hypothetical protein
MPVGNDGGSFHRLYGRNRGVVDNNVLWGEHGGHGAQNIEESLTVGYEDLDVLGGFRNLGWGTKKIRLGTK